MMTIVVPGASCAAVFFAGGLIHTARGKSAGCDRPLTKRSGCAAYAAGEHLLALRADRGGLAEMHDGGREEPQAAVAVFLVVPGKEDLPKRPSVLERPEALWKLRTVLERLKLRFRERIVVRHVRAAVGLGHAEVGQQQRHRFALHGRPAVRMERELARLNAVLRAGLADEVLGQGRALVWGEHPADHVPAEDVEDDVEIEVRPLRRTQELRDVPAPDFVRTRGQ